MGEERRVLYADAGTSKNGQPGQESWIVVHDEWEMVAEEYLGDCTINVAEIVAIQRAIELAGREETEIVSDSQLAVNLINRAWKAHAPHLKALVETIHLPEWIVLSWVPRDQNLAGHYLEEKYQL